MDFLEVGAARMALTGAVMVAVTLAILPPLWLGVRRIFPGRNVFFARWGFLDIGRVIVLGIAVSFLAGPLVGWIEAPLLRNLAGSILVSGTMGALCVHLAVKTEPSGVRSLGFESERTGRSIFAGLFLYAGTLPGILGLSLIAPWAVELGGGVFELQSMLPEFLELQGGARVIAIVGMVLVVPFLEELLFRGFLQPLLVQNLREPGGIALTSFVFAVLHGGSMFLPVFGLSLVLGTVKLRTQRLAASWCVHAAHNGIVLLFISLSPEVRSALSS